MDASTGQCRWDTTSAHGKRGATSCTGESHPHDTGISSKKTLPKRSNEVHRSWIGVERSKRTSGPQERTESGRIRNGNFAPEYRQHLDHNNVLGILTYVFLTTRYLAYAGSQVGPVGIHHMVEECGVLWRTGRRLELIPAGLPRDHMPILFDSKIHTAASEVRDSHITV